MKDQVTPKRKWMSNVDTNYPSDEDELSELSELDEANSLQSARTHVVPLVSMAHTITSTMCKSLLGIDANCNITGQFVGHRAYLRLRAHGKPLEVSKLCGLRAHAGRV